MKEISAVQELVDIIHRLHDGIINFNEAKRQAYEVFQGVETILGEGVFNLAFPVLVEYFFDPAKKVRAILQKKEISRNDLLRLTILRIPSNTDSRSLAPEGRSINRGEKN